MKNSKSSVLLNLLANGCGICILVQLAGLGLIYNVVLFVPLFSQNMPQEMSQSNETEKKNQFHIECQKWTSLFSVVVPIYYSGFAQA